MQETLEQRIKVLEKCKSNPQLQAIENELCFRDILYWFRNYTYTDKNNSLYDKTMPSVIPFIPYPFQEELITEVWDCVVNWEPVFIDKSRQMGISRVLMWVFVYWFLFHNHKYLCISQKENDVDKLWDMKSLFEKARFILTNLPSWMLPKWFKREMWSENNKYMNISRPDGSWSITWESANPNASRWGTYTAIFADEFAFQSNASSINKAMTSASPCRIYASTPNGKFNEHYKMKLLAEPTKNKYWDIEPAKIKWLRYHWSDHPLYTKERYQKKIEGMDSVSIAQELEIDYDTAVVWRVYPEFPKEESNIEYNPEKPLYISIDNSHGWTDPNAVIVAQVDWAYWNLIDYIEYNSTPEDSANFLWWTPKMQINNRMLEFLERYMTYSYKRAIFIADPYDTKSAMGNSTILDDYRKVGINLVVPEERSKQEQILKTRTNLHRIRYNKNCLDLASFILNARYPERKEDSSSTKPFMLPIHNQTSHARTALEYFVTYMCENPIVQEKRILEDTRPKRDYATWRLIYKESLDLYKKRVY